MKIRILILAGLSLVTIFACVVAKKYHFRELYNNHNDLIHQSSKYNEKPFLKAHLKNGGVCILDDKWTYDSISSQIVGFGKYYDFKRNDVIAKQLNIHVDSVLLFETNTKLVADKSARVQAMSIMTALDVILGIACLTMPKACFGSCPTFYLQNGDYQRLADAESFSNAIAPSLAYQDYDDLNYEARCGEELNLKMMNEALETHVVKRANLTVISKKKSEQVYITPDDTYYATSNGGRLINAKGAEGDVTGELLSLDGEERYSLADENALVTKEEIFLEFAADPHIDLGLKITFRQTMMTTYALYSAIGYMGNEVGDIFATLESSSESSDKMKTMFYDALGAIEIYSLQANNTWKFEGEIFETGPIARNHELLPLKYDSPESGKINIKLVMNKGLWRIDHTELVQMKKEKHAVDIKPHFLLKNGQNKSVHLQKLIDHSDSFIVSMPGDEFLMGYTMPECEEDENYQVFLNAEGYYIEWMRESWLKDKDLLNLYKLMNDPVAWLNGETANYKKYEAKMEDQFWKSRWTQKHKSNESL
ncbi:MAG: hypothetical protein IPO92_05680 [Saprospiraceae bacterium]|nr:hypothetical protein [Saprospiraceae bacterium]